MEHWKSVLDLPIFEIQYESLVENTEGLSRETLEFLDLDWEENCRDFRATNRAVSSASSWQVRQPIYSSSVGRWRNYKTSLKPLITAMQREGIEFDL